MKLLCTIYVTNHDIAWKSYARNLFFAMMLRRHNINFVLQGNGSSTSSTRLNSAVRKSLCNRQLILLQGSSSLQLACSRRSAFSRCTIYSLPTDRSALLSERLEQATLELALFTPSPKKTLTISNDS